jgi:phosphatidate cytidylyltransferase
MKQRIISAIVALLIIIPIIIVGGNLFYIAVGLISILGLYELINIRETKRKFPVDMKQVSYLLFILLVINNYNNSGFIYSIDYRVISVLLIILLLPLVFYGDNDKYNVNDAFYLLGSIFFLGIAFNLLIAIRNYNINYFIYIMLITTITDTYAYLTGKFIGKHKFMPSVSPKKTWEGFLGGLFFGTLISCVFYYDVINSNINILSLISITAFLSIIGQFGDLVFSSIKRYFNKKDYSNIMPGHGGILDRLDSIIFVIIAFTLFITLI